MRVNLTKRGRGLVPDGLNFPKRMQSLIDWTLMSSSACFRTWTHAETTAHGHGLELGETTAHMIGGCCENTPSSPNVFLC